MGVCLGTFCRWVSGGASRERSEMVSAAVAKGRFGSAAHRGVVGQCR